MVSIIISLISGILLSLAFPRTSLHWLAWFMLAPLMYYTFRLTWKQAILSGLVFGIGYFGSLLYWIAIFGKLPWIALALFEALFVVAFVVVGKLIGTRLGLWGRFGLLPALWVALEWTRSLGIFGFTWGDIGYSQHQVLPVIQIASITGVWGVSMLLAMSNAALANLLTARGESRGMRSAHIQVLVVAMVIIGVLVHGLFSMRMSIAATGHELRAAVIQGDINPDLGGDAAHCERNWQTYSGLTLQASGKGADLIVWPEGAVPGCVGAESFAQRRIIHLANAADSCLLVGGRDADEDDRIYNSAFLIRPEIGMVGRYAKVHLVPFGEYVLWREHLPFLKYYRVTKYDLSPGAAHNLMDAGDYRVGTAICFESIFPDIARTMTASGANLLCIITNDSWFLRTSAAEQHMSMSAFRAIENRRYLVRAAATGVSCIIDPHGRVLTRSELFRSGALTSDVRTLTGRSIFTRHGNWLVYACLALVAFLAAVGMTRLHCSSQEDE